MSQTHVSPRRPGETHEDYHRRIVDTLKTANPDCPYYAAEDFGAQGAFALYVHGARCRGGYSREHAEQLAKEANDNHEASAKKRRLITAAPDLLAILRDLLPLAESLDEAMTTRMAACASTTQRLAKARALLATL